MQRHAKNGRPRRLPVTIKFDKMVAKNIKKSVKEIFETHIKTLKKHNLKETDSDSDSKNEYYCMTSMQAKPLHCLICADLHKNVKKLTT